MDKRPSDQGHGDKEQRALCPTCGTLCVLHPLSHGRNMTPVTQSAGTRTGDDLEAILASRATFQYEHDPLAFIRLWLDFRTIPADEFRVKYGKDYESHDLVAMARLCLTNRTPQSASEAFRPSAAAVAKAREYMDEPLERNRVKADLGKMGRMVNGKTEEGELLSSIIDDGEVLAREILRLDCVTNSPSDRSVAP